MRDGRYYQRAILPVAYVGFGMSVAMAICGVAGLLMNPALALNPAIEPGSATTLFVSALVTALFSGAAWYWVKDNSGGHFGRRHAALAVTLIWLGSGVFGGLPFILHAGISPADAFFEAISGFTTTGATILPDIEGTLSRPMLLWRSVMQWLGGMGIVVLFVAIFPNVGAGGKHLFRSEVPGPTAEGLQPRIAETSMWLWQVYLGLTLLQCVILFFVGMGPFDALCHSLTTLSTGGFSTRNDSLAAFQSPAIDVVVSTFMLIAGVNFGLYFGALRYRTVKVFFRSTEFKVYLSLVVGTTLAIALGIASSHHGPLESLRLAYFIVATTITSTGFGLSTEDYGTLLYRAYPSSVLVIIILLMCVGGMAGSTAGGIKVSRVTMLAKMAVVHVRRNLRPTVVQVVRMNKKAVQSSVLNEVAAFFILFVSVLGVGTLLITYTDNVPAGTAFGAMLTCISNMGPNPYFISDGDHFHDYTDGAKVLFSFAMILGRLEFFTLLSLLLPDFWKR